MKQLTCVMPVSKTVVDDIEAMENNVTTLEASFGGLVKQVDDWRAIPTDGCTRTVWCRPLYGVGSIYRPMVFRGTTPKQPFGAYSLFFPFLDPLQARAGATRYYRMYAVLSNDLPAGQTHNVAVLLGMESTRSVRFTFRVIPGATNGTIYDAYSEEQYTDQDVNDMRFTTPDIWTECSTASSGSWSFRYIEMQLLDVFPPVAKTPDGASAAVSPSSPTFQRTTDVDVGRELLQHVATLRVVARRMRDVADRAENLAKSMRDALSDCPRIVAAGRVAQNYLNANALKRLSTRTLMGMPHVRLNVVETTGKTDEEFVSVGRVIDPFRAGGVLRLFGLVSNATSGVVRVLFRFDNGQEIQPTFGFNRQSGLLDANGVGFVIDGWISQIFSPLPRGEAEMFLAVFWVGNERTKFQIHYLELTMAEM